MFEIIGFTGSLFVILSYIFKDMTKLRIVNMIGCVVWIIYGLLIHSYSTIFTNLVIMIIHIVNMVRK